jgi:hypothetical protein
MPRLSKIGAAALAAFGWTSGAASVTANYLVVAGGAAGGFNGNGGGGGAGGLLASTTSLSLASSYTVTVGAGGTSVAAISSTNGSNSVFNAITAIGGGAGGPTASGVGAGNSGGSGGGGLNDSTNYAGGSGTSGQGNAGGASGGGGAPYPAGGGGGAGGAGTAGTSGGQGGVGSTSSITGTSTYYAGGGGGARSSGSASAGGLGGGGNGGVASVGIPGTANTGGGGGGTGAAGGGGQGGSGVVIISYPSPQKFGGGIVTTSGSNTIHTFTTSGTLSPLSTLTASYLIVAGGAGGGGTYNGASGGGGAGGLLSGSGTTIDTNSIYVVTVGAGGAGGAVIGQPAGSEQNGTSGGNSLFSVVSTTAVGGGGGGSRSNVGASGGSGGGGGWITTGNAGGAATSGQGFAGGSGGSGGSQTGGGGGGASEAGNTDGNAEGGDGSSSSISGSAVTYAGGGGGGGYGTTPGGGGAGGGGAGSNGDGTTGGSGTVNTGSGGGGGGGSGFAWANGGAGGSGIVIISYAGSTQLMAGGTVTISGGNVIHTFTSSGYLTPLTLVGNSLRFRGSSFLSRTPTVAGNRRTWTWSGWVKLSSLPATTPLFAAYIGSGSTDNDYFALFYDQTTGALRTSGYSTPYLISSAFYRDFSAWYHVTCAVDTTSSTANNRIRLYVNGVELTSFSTRNNPSQNADLGINQAALHEIGQNGGFGVYFNGYMTEINFIDGQALTPNSFGTFNSYGVWQPIRYGGSYGTNGFYLPFNQGGSTFGGNFNGTNQLISVAANAAFNFTGDFTAECWYNTSTVTNASQPTIFTIGSDANGLVVAFFGGAFYCYMLGVGGYMTAATPPLNQWVHLAWVRVGSTNTLYLNGVAAATATSSGTLSSTGGVTVGRTGTSGTAFQHFQGLVSNFRLTNYAVYTSNFVPPTSALTAISGTQLLTLQSSTIVDNSTNAFTITNTGSVTTATATTPVFANTRTLTADQSPAGNNWTANNISVTTGSTYDSMTDVPTLTSTTAANYCTLNPLQRYDSLSAVGVYSAANLIVTPGGNPTHAFGTMAIAPGSTDGFYWEGVCTSMDSVRTYLGIVSPADGPVAVGASYAFNSKGVLSNTGGYFQTLTNGTADATYTSYTTNDVIMVAYKNGKLWFGKNGTWMNSGNPSADTGAVSTTLSTSKDWFPYFGYNSTWSTNFGQRPFTYTPPTGFLPLNTFNL